jgi:hypothetical protein
MGPTDSSTVSNPETTHYLPSLLALRLVDRLENHAGRLADQAQRARLLADGLRSGRFTIEEDEITHGWLDISGEDGHVAQVQGGHEEGEVPFDLIRNIA